MVSVLRRREDAPDEQLLKLYWNRAEVKRELNFLKRERIELLDRLKDQEGAIHQAQEQLNGLERLLVNPKAAANAMVYFQLRHLWKVGTQRLEQFGSELEVRLSEREKNRVQGAAAAKQSRRLEAIETNAVSLNEKLERISGAIESLEKRLARMNVVLRLVKAGSIRAKIGKLLSNRELVEEQIVDLRELSDRIQGEPLPEPEGMSIENRRTINTALIALAQHLVLHFADNDLAVLAKRAHERPVGDLKFGDRRECDRMVECIRGRVADLQQDTKLGAKVKRRADMIKKELGYRGDGDSVPTSYSTSMITPIVEGNEARRSTDAPVNINVIADNYWDLSEFFR